MSSRRLIVELLLALILAWFAMTVDESFAVASVSNQPCGKGLTALSDPPTGTQDGGAPVDTSNRCPAISAAVDW